MLFIYKVLHSLRLIDDSHMENIKLKHKGYKKIASSDYFDAEWYKKEYAISAKNPALHYLLEGWKLGYNPSLKFNTSDYLAINQDVKKFNICPLLHYETYGKKENRNIGILNRTNKTIKKTDNSPNQGVIYCCITNNYDNPPIHHYVDENWDYVLFSDNDELIAKKQYAHWQVRPLQYTKSDNIRNARWHKTHPHVLFPNHKYSIWLDGNIIVCGNFLFNKANEHLEQKHTISVASHPNRNCLYQEAELLKQEGKDYPEIIDKQISFIKSQGFPKNYGLNETNVMLRFHHDKKCISIMEDWWHIIHTYSRRDQLSFNFCLWKSNYDMTDFSSPSEIRGNPEHFCLYFGASHKGVIQKK